MLKWFQNGKRSSDRWLVLESVLVTLVKWLSWVGPGVPGFILAHVTVFERDGRLCWMQNTRKSPRLKGDVSRVHNQPKLEKRKKEGRRDAKKTRDKKEMQKGIFSRARTFLFLTTSRLSWVSFIVSTTTNSPIDRLRLLKIFDDQRLLLARSWEPLAFLLKKCVYKIINPIVTSIELLFSSGYIAKGTLSFGIYALISYLFRVLFSTSNLWFHTCSESYFLATIYARTRANTM